MRLFPCLLAAFSFFCAVSGSAAPWPAVDIRGRAINDWCYQLQGKNGAALSLGAIGASKFDLAVIDYSADGSADGEFSAAQIAALRNSAGGTKTVLAYMSIGEAEDYRFYWNPAWADAHGRLTAQAPAWLAAQDSSWSGNFKVRYWDASWQAIIYGTASGAAKSYLDRIIDAGYDGVYLDIIDAFEFFGPDGNNERPTAAADMAAFVEALSHYARVTRGVSDFIVVPQNGTDLVRELDTSALADYFAAIDAVGAEDTFFYGPRENNNRWQPQLWTIENLDVFRANAKPVLAIDYVTTAPRVNRFYKACAVKGYVPCTAVRALDRLTLSRTHPAD